MKKGHTHAHPTLDTQAHMSHVAKSPMRNKTWKNGGTHITLLLLLVKYHYHVNFNSLDNGHG